MGADLAEASPDVLRQMITSLANAMMSAQADQVCGAEYGERSDERTNQRNGYRAREWDTRAGTVELAVPKLRQGSFFPDWLLTHRRRAEQALVTVVATAYLLGVSTRRVERLAEQFGVKSLSRSQVSEMAAHLDAQVSAFRSRPLDAGPYTFCWVDALTVKVREDGRVVNVHALIATGVNADGHREILGLDVASAEDGAGWLAFLRGLVARGLSGVQLVISDAHPGLVAAIGVRAARCVLAAVSHPLPAQLVDPRAQVGAAPRGHPGPHDLRPGRHRCGHRAVRPGGGRAGGQVPGRGRASRRRPRGAAGVHRLPAGDLAADLVEQPQERLNKEIRRRTDVVGIFPGRDALIRLVGAVLAEQSDEWTEGRRYMGLDVLASTRVRIVAETDPAPTTSPVTPEPLTA